jgi:N-acetylneuraminic acid mutarotase
MLRGKLLLVCLLAGSIAALCGANLWQDIDDMAAAVMAIQPATGTGDTPITWPTQGVDAPSKYDGGSGCSDGSYYYTWGMESTVKKLQRYDPGANTWSNMTDSPAGTLFGGLAYLAGNMYGGRGYYGQTFYKYVVAINVWSNLANYPFPRYGFMSVAHSNKIWCVGGYHAGGVNKYTNGVCVYNPDNNTWDSTTFAPLPQAFYLGGLVEWGGQIYCFGGYNGTASSTNMYRYNDGANTWTQLAGLPYPTDMQVGVATGTKIVSIGGSDETTATNAVFAYYNDAWHVEAASFPYKFRNAAGAVVGGKIYVSHGYVNSSFDTNALWISNTLP